MSLLSGVSSPRASLDRVRQALVSAGRTPTKSGDRFMVRCVCCDDKNPSLSVTWDAGRGLTKVHAFCCDAPFTDIMAAIGLDPADAFDEPMPERREDRPRPATRRPSFKAHKLPARLTNTDATGDADPKSQKWEVVTVYSYADAAGTVLQEVVREQCTMNEHTQKRFTQRFLNPTTGRMIARKPTGFVPVLYNHAEVLTAITAKKTVWLLEGEKDVDNATKLGLVATTNAQGANSFPDSLVEIFNGGFVNIVADRDVAGYTRAQTLSRRLTEAGAVVRLFLPAVTDDKSDLTDHLEAGHSIDDLVPITADDAAALAALGEAHRTIAKIDTAQQETQARVDRATASPDPAQRQADQEHAGTWSAEAEIQFRRVRDLISETSKLKAGDVGKGAITQLRALEFTAANDAAAVHTTAGARIPSSISEAQKSARHNLAPGDVIDISTGASQRPPIDRGHDTDWDDDGEQENEGTRFKVRHGETVEVKVRKDGEGFRNRYELVLRGWGQVQSVDVEDDGQESHVTRVSHGMTIKFWRYKRDNFGKPIHEDGTELIEEATVHWDADQLRDGSWANALPWPGMLAKSSRQGREAAMDALMNARQAPSNRTTVYTTSGWRKSDAGWFFIHFGGAIAKGGTLDLQVDLSQVYSPYTLPAPTTEADKLREAWIKGTEPLSILPSRVLGPMLGGAWESVFHPVPMITHFQGGRAAAKTATAGLGLQYFAPGVHYHGKREILSGSKMGGTVIGLLRALGGASYLPTLVDDFAPDGDPKKAQTKLGDLARMSFNGITRTIGKQRGGIALDAPILASPITTGELGTTGSADSRVMTIRLDPDTIPNKAATFSELEKSEARKARSLLGSSLIRWIAEHRDALLEERTQDAENSNASLSYWRQKLTHLPHNPEIIDRLSGDAAARAHGLKLMLRMMVTQKALTPAEADAYYAWCEEGLVEAYALQETTASDPAEQLLGYLRQAVYSGDGYFTTTDGKAPESLETTLGWALRGGGEYATWIPIGKRLGAVKNGRLLLLPAEVLSVVNKLATQADELFSETHSSITSSFISHGWVIPDKNGRRSVGRRIGGVKIKVWDIPLEAYLGEDDDPTAEPDEMQPPTISPDLPGTLFDTPEQIVPDEPHTPEPVPTPSPEEPVQTPATEEPASQDHPASAAEQWTPPARAVTPTRTTTAMKGKYRASLAVLHTNGLWFPNGDNAQLPYPIEHLGDVARLVADLNLGTVVRTWKGKGGIMQSRDEGGQLLVTKEAAIGLGIPLDQLPESHFDVKEKLQELTTNHPMITAAIDAGWEVGGPATNKFLNGVTRVWHTENRNLRAQFILIPGLKDDFGHLVNDDPTPATIAKRLQRFTDELHFPFTISASTTGLNLMETLQWKDREILFAPSNPVPPALVSVLERDINWSRKPTEEELAHKYVHAYDRGGSYLAGVSGTNFGVGDPEHFPEGCDFDRKLPGYWRVPMPHRGEWLIPNPIAPNKDGDVNEGSPIWVSTPTLEIATDLGYSIEPIEAYVWPQHQRLLDGWYERIRDARTSLDTDDVDDQLARDLLKEVYVRSLGLMGSHDFRKGQSGYAPERYHLIQARAKANILRRVQKIGTETGRWPIAILKDTVLYTSNEIDPHLAWPGSPDNYGRGLGQYKYEKSGILAEQLRYFNGAGYEGKLSLDVWI